PARKEPPGGPIRLSCLARSRRGGRNPNAVPPISEMSSAPNSPNAARAPRDLSRSPSPPPANLFAQVPEKPHSLITTVPWCYMLCVAIEERSELKDVVLPDDDEFTTTLRGWVEDADLRGAMSQAHMECLRTGIAYV